MRDGQRGSRLSQMVSVWFFCLEQWDAPRPAACQYWREKLGNTWASC